MQFVLTQELIDRVLEQILKDIEEGDLTALEELVKCLPKSALIAYLPEGEYNA